MPIEAFGLATLDLSPIPSNPDPMLPTNLDTQRTDMQAPSSARCGALFPDSNALDIVGT